MEQTNFPLALTFNDILLLPGYADFSRSEINLSTKLTKNITLAVPFVSSPMDTVTESPLASELAAAGGIGIIHRNLTISQQADEVAKVAKKKQLVGAATGAQKGFEERAAALVKAGVTIICVDSADGYKRNIIDAISFLKNTYPNIDIISGNVATYEGAKAMIAAGVDAIRVGMGPGAICTTRIITGMGVPQATAIKETVRAAKTKKVPVIADGGLTYSGDMTKALALGASTVMMGSFFASTAEAPGTIITLTKEQVPQRFKSVFSKTKKTYQFKEYRGMGSIGAMKKGAQIKSEDEFHGKSYQDRTLIAEGVEGMVPIKGTVMELVEQACGGIRSGMFHVGAKTLPELVAKARFIQVTQASLTESHPHDILITNPGENY